MGRPKLKDARVPVAARLTPQQVEQLRGVVVDRQVAGGRATLSGVMSEAVTLGLREMMRRSLRRQRAQVSR